MEAKFIAPRDNCSGNLLWNKEQFHNNLKEISESLVELRSIGYWVSPFPEGDGVTFNFKSKDIIKSNEEMLADFQSCFHWVVISVGESKDSNTELANLEVDREMSCIVIIPLYKIFIQETLSVGPYSFFCRKEFDTNPSERFTNYENEYLQFKTNLKYKDLLRLNKTIDHNDYVINKCLSLAESALDILRYVHSSFSRKEFTPNPAGQMNDGFFEVEIIPVERTHIKPLRLAGISRPISITNNWLGPQVDDIYAPGVDYLISIHNGDIDDDMASSVKSTLRLCRQSFYSLGSESQFLNLVFALDGLVQPKGTGWQHRTYIAALLSNGCSDKFEKTLIRYNELYVEVRNKLVHKGLDFYQLTENPNLACDTIYEYIKDVIVLISREKFTDVNQMRLYAKNILKTFEFKDKYTLFINSILLPVGQTHKMPSW
tara:strand:+ start:2468 stop:3757 length:1290 start_codon:yes stop_codon:yes gene_type:complete